MLDDFERFDAYQKKHYSTCDETCKRLDNLISKDEISIFIPNNAKIIPNFKNLKVIKSNKSCKIFPLWEHITFSNFVKKQKAQL